MREAMTTIKQPYRDCYGEGYDSVYSCKNPYPVSEIGKRCAWQAGFNDRRASVNN